ncbi:MAG: T9SS type A sorting domain-containing protein [Bacteroidales bacterium]|nr:T9SS type A sorting domain-containing protein [Bacteroidales bacterium]
MPNNSNDPNSGNDSLIVTGITTAISGTFTIGTTGDFATFNDAVNLLITNGICGPVVFNVESGVYEENVTIPAIIGSSSVNTITFQSVTGVNTDVTLQYNPSGTGDNYVFKLSGADYVTVQNIKIRAYGSGNYGYAVVLEGGADYNTISNCIIYSKSNTSSSSACVYSTSTSADNYNTFIGNTVRYGYYGFYLYASSASPEMGNQMIDNYIYEYYYHGIYTYYNYDVIADGNYCYQRPAGSTTNYGIYVYYGDGATRVVNNTVFDDAGSTYYGIRLSYCDPTSSGSALVANNMVSCAGVTGTVYSMYLYYSTDLKCYNNSVSINSGGTTYGIYLYGSTTYTGPYDLKNNCVANYDGLTAIYCNNTAVNFTSDHNNWYSTGNNPVYYGAALTTFAQWQASFPGDILSVDPEFLAVDNLHTASIYMNAAGTPVPEVTTDIDGDIRNTTSPDIGADEFNLALPPVDLALSLLYHLGEVPLAGASDVVNVTVQNVGNNDQYNYPVILNITGANTFVDTVFISYIPTGGFELVNFAPFTPTSIGLNNIAVSVPNDGDNTNNFLTGYNHGTLNRVSYADTTGTAGSGGNNDSNGHIYWNKHSMTGLKAVGSIQAYISDDVNNVGNTVYGAVMDANFNQVALSNPYVLASTDLSSYITLTFADPSQTLFFNAEYYLGFAQTTPVGANYFPIGYQDEIPMRPNTYFNSGNINGSGFTAYTNDRRWMIKAILIDPAPYDAACVAIPSPIDGCGLSMETVSIKIQNYGMNAIAGNLTAYYQVNNNPVVSQAVTTGIPSGDTLIFSFTTLADFTTGADSIFELTAWISLTSDLNQNNDTAFTTVESFYQPPSPVAVNTTVLYGSMATLSVISTDSITWFDDPLSTTPITTGNSLTVGPLYDTATFYAQAGSVSGGGLAITEMDLGTDDYIEIQNLTSSTLDATNWIVAISNSYTDINSINSIYWDLGVFAPDEVQIRTDLASSPNYWGINMFWNPGAPTSFRGWAMIIDDQGEIVDFVIWGWTASDIAAWNPIINTFAVNPSSAWNGDALMTFPNNFLRRVNYDNDDVTDWTNPTSGDIGLPNFGMNISSSLYSCASDMVQVNAYVANIPANDIGVIAAYSPVSGTNLTNAETVSVEINNWGSLPANLFQVTYDITGATSNTVTELVAFATPIASGTSSTFTFNTPADLSAYGVYYFDVFTQLSGDGFAANDTLSFVVVNSAPVFCSSGATSSAYEEIVQVNLSNISNYSFPSGSLYSNYNNSVAPGVLVQGNAHQISITSDFAPGSSTSYACWVEVYIDWDNDGAYTEPQETGFSSAITSSQTVSGMIAVPLTAALGNHSMRVVMEQTTSAAGVVPCGYYTYGETEDYQVFVQPPYAIDAGAITILSPNGSLLENSSYPVEVVVYNYGTSTITNMNVVYTVNGLNPVTTAYVGTLPSFTADTIMLGNVTVPGGTFELCAYTVLANDNSPLNDATCATLYADPQYNLAMLSIDAPVEGCDLGLEEVTVTFTNLADTVIGNIPLSFYTSNMTAPVTETYTGTLNPGDTATYTFSTMINLAVTVNTEFEIFAYVSYPLDPVQANDTATSMVNSLTIPAAPIANNVTIWAGTTTTLEVVSPDPNLLYAWFDAMGGNLLENGTQYLTPLLFDTTTFVVQASNAVTGDIQVGTQTNVTATTGYPSPYGSYYWGNKNQFLIRADELIALGFGAGTINSLAFRTVTVVPLPLTNFTLKIGHTTANSITTWDPSPLTQVYFNPSFVDVVGWNVHEFSTPFEWDGVSNVLIETCFNNSSYLSGSQVQYSNVGFNASVNYHGDNATVCSSTATSSITNSQRPNMLLNILIPGCASYTEVTANVQYANLDGAVLDITSPVSASNMNNAAVTIDIYNNGLLNFSNFNVQYTVNGGTPVTQLVNTTLTPGQVYSFTFTDSVSASVFGTYAICAKIILVGDGYAANDQFCTTFTNWDGNGESCATAFPYLVINDPPVYQTTIHPYDRQWWRFELPVDASNVDVSLCGSSFDTKLEVHSECPASSFLLSSFLGSNDNSCGQQSKVHFNALSAGTYYARVFGYQGEFGDYVLEITGTFADIAIVNFTTTQIQCNGAANGSVVASVTPIIPGASLPLTYLWSNGATGLSLNGLAPGTYILTVTDALGIPQVESLTITEPPALAFSLSGTDVTTLGGNDGTITTTISGGVSPYAFSWSNGATTQNIAAAYAGIYSLTVLDANNCILEDDITINSPLPAGWTVTPTANSHLIIVDQYSNITLDGLNAAYGSLIGVFYNQNGTMVCAGWAYWSGMATSVTAYGATPPIDNGYQPGETFTWRLYEASLGVEYGGPACYIASYPNQGTYITGGFSGINCLNAQSIILQPINLPFGWSIWSTYVDPVDPNMVAIFDSIASYVTIVKSGSGQIYWPLYSLNTIGNAVKGQGYQIKMSTQKLLHVQGLLIDPVVSPINIPGGWSIIGYLRTTPMNAVTVMSPIVSQIVIVKSGSGQIYWPLYNLNTIGNMVPGQGYQIKMLSLQSFTFPANTAAPTKSDAIPAQPEKYNKVSNTGHNMSLGILEDAWDVAPQEGDEIGVFNAKGNLIGSTVYQVGFNAITVWGDDSYTENTTEGIANGDVFTLKLWSYRSDTEQELVVKSWLQGNDQYGKDAISVVEKLVVMSEDFNGFKLYQNVPNPFKDVTEITFYIPKSSHVRLVVYNALGEMIEELVSARYDAGKYSVLFETGNLSSGTYFYKIVSDKFTDTKVMNIQ